MLASKEILRSSSVALFLLVMSSLANSVPLIQLSRATGKYLTTQVHRGDGMGSRSAQSCRHDIQLICHGDAVIHISSKHTLYLW